MFNRVLLVCLLSVSLYSAASSLSCSWMDNKFRQYIEGSRDLLETMANNSTNTTEDAEAEDTVTFPNELYNQASTASAEDKLQFIVQILEETAVLFEEDYSLASWEENTADNFANVVTQLTDGLRSCIGNHGHKKNKKLRVYFKRLSSQVLKKMGHSAAAWELIREEIRIHLMRAYQLLKSN